MADYLVKLGKDTPSFYTDRGVPTPTYVLGGKAYAMIKDIPYLVTLVNKNGCIRLEIVEEAYDCPGLFIDTTRHQLKPATAEDARAILNDKPGMVINLLPMSEELVIGRYAYFNQRPIWIDEYHSDMLGRNSSLNDHQYSLAGECRGYRLFEGRFWCLGQYCCREILVGHEIGTVTAADYTAYRYGARSDVTEWRFFKRAGQVYRCRFGLVNSSSRLPEDFQLDF